MKMLVIAVDGHGAFRCSLVRNPDLFRREIAGETGAGHIVWAAIPILAANAGEYLNHVQHQVLPRFIAREHLQHDRGFVIAMAWAWLGRPLLGLVARNLRNRVMRIIRALFMPAHNLILRTRQGERP